MEPISADVIGHKCGAAVLWSCSKLDESETSGHHFINTAAEKPPVSSDDYIPPKYKYDQRQPIKDNTVSRWGSETM